MFPDEKVNFSSEVTKSYFKMWKGAKIKGNNQPSLQSIDLGWKVSKACLRDPDSLFSAASGRCKSQQILYNS